MNSQLHLTKEYCVYPGEYNPLPETAILLNQLNDSHIMVAEEEPVTVEAFESCYSMELLVSGVHREEIFIDVQDNILCIRVLQKNANQSGYKAAGIDSIAFERYLSLPEDADPEFVIAEYRHDILKIYVPKTVMVSTHAAGHIVVY